MYIEGANLTFKAIADEMNTLINGEFVVMSVTNQGTKEEVTPVCRLPFDLY